MTNNQVSDQEIEREVKTLRNLRRRSVTSVGPGALPLDPDLPPPSPSQGSPNEEFPHYTSNDDITLSSPDGLDGEGLFWVPAHLHPELAPGEFRAFLKSHTHPDPTHAEAVEAGEAPGLSRSPSWIARNPSRRGVEGLGRKKSMLSKQYLPKAGDGVDEDRPPIPSRQSLHIFGGKTGEKGLTLQDLQKLEELVEEAGEEDDPENMRKILRRSLSMNVPPGFLQDDVPQGGSADAPLIAPRPNSILRRSARTKIRKTGLAGDGGGHRFAATRKGRMTAAPQKDIPGLEDDDYAPSEYLHHAGSDEVVVDGEEHSNDSHDNHQDGTMRNVGIRRVSDASVDEANIFDAYTHDPNSAASSSHDHSTSPSPESSPPNKKMLLPATPLASQLDDVPDWFDNDRTPALEASGQHSVQKDEYEKTIPGVTSAVGDLAMDNRFSQRPEPLSGPLLGSAKDSHEFLPGMAPPAERTNISSSSHVNQSTVPTNLEKPPLIRTDTSTSSSSVTSAAAKEKKGKFFSKKKEKDDKEKKGKKDKDGFLGSLFGGKKKNEESSSVSNFSSAGPAAAAALLGTSKSAKSTGIPPSPSPSSSGFHSNYARYPIHVERAVYRLSHIKLANARRPLYEQVLISNLMFWYLGVLGRNVTEEKKASADEKEEAKPIIKGTPHKPVDTGSLGTPSPPATPTLSIRTIQPNSHSEHTTQVAHQPDSGSMQVQVPTKKTSLSKPERSRDGRNNETPVRSPQYSIQTAQVDQGIRNVQNQNKPQQMGHMSPMRQPSPHSPQQVQNLPASHASLQQHSPSPAQAQLQRSVTPNGPQGPDRTRSPPSPGANGLRVYEGYSHREVPSSARGVPQSSFVPPHPGQGQGAPGSEPRQRTMSSPSMPPPGLVPSSGGPPARRVVTDGRIPAESAPRPLYTQHSGPQPGQLFQYPGGSGPYPGRPPLSSGPQPGQIFNHSQHLQGPPQPGQIFHRPQHPPQARPPHPQRPPQPPHPRPQYGPRPPQPPGQQGWEPPQRLPPGAGPPQWAGARPPQGVPGQPFDSRRPQGYPPQVQGQGYYGGAGPVPGMQGRPPLPVQQGQYGHQGEYGHHR
ncbi:hypothetical protein L204_103100 [Cryptococcus depauperatus]|nr:hypothetical protein L204_00155 [Cryptococcus depauperatus CBS 7855]